ncbi:MAG TPA: methyltransferase domain-containing protein [Thermodesulfobacteriota bacterium]|nr:methyltransferase domain-containing protein [Thermodesulfobacteriota bacterium]
MYHVRQLYQNKTYAAGYEKTRFKGIYGRFRNWNTTRVISKLIRFTGREGFALDIPCGTGRLSHLILKSGYKWIGGDISLEMMMESRKRMNGFEESFSNIRLDAEAMAFKDDTIDCVFSIRFIYHIPVEIRYRMLQEMRRITKKWLIIDYNYPNRFKEMARRIGSLFGAKPIKRRISLQEISNELKDNGFSIHKAILASRFFSDNVLLLCSK